MINYKQAEKTQLTIQPSPVSTNVATNPRRYWLRFNRVSYAYRHGYEWIIGFVIGAHTGLAASNVTIHTTTRLVADCNVANVEGCLIGKIGTADYAIVNEGHILPDGWTNIENAELISFVGC